MTGLTKRSLADALSALVSSVAVRTRAFIYMPAWNELWAVPPHPGTMSLLLTSLSLVKRRKEAGKVVRLKDTPRLPDRLQVSVQALLKTCPEVLLEHPLPQFLFLIHRGVTSYLR